MEEYKKNKAYLGMSDIASLTLRSPMEAVTLDFGMDGTYYAWMVDDESVTIPDHYRKVYECDHWMKVYDDDTCSLDVQGKHIEVYRAGGMGCLIRIL